MPSNQERMIVVLVGFLRLHKIAQSGDWVYAQCHAQWQANCAKRKIVRAFNVQKKKEEEKYERIRKIEERRFPPE